MAYQDTSVLGSGYGNPYLDSLIWGCKWTDGSVTYAFGPENYSASGIPSLSWSPDERQMFRNIFQSYSNVCGITFQEVDYSISANIVEWKVDSLGGSDGYTILGQHDVPDGTWLQNWGLFSTGGSYWSTKPGSTGYSTVVHELGHAIGLAHPHDGGDRPDATLFPGVSSDFSTGTYALNQGIWTAMSYNSGWNDRPSGTYAYGEVLTPMAFDIAALQKLYGANYAFNTEDNTYTLVNKNSQGTGWSCIWDAGGIDTISNATASVGCTINLNEAPLIGRNAGGYVSAGNGICGGFTIANNVTIENAVGGSGNDILIGNITANYLAGGLGDDQICGGAGNDTIDCGDGSDYVWYDYARSNYTISRSGDTYTVVALSGDEGSDQIVGAEYLKFSDQTVSVVSLDFTPPSTLILVGQVFTGTSSVDTLTGGAGNDVMIGLGGTDVLNGGEDSDLYVMISKSDHTAAEINDTGARGTDEVRFTSTTASTLTLYATDRGIERVVIGTGATAMAVTTGITDNNVNAAALRNGVSLVGNSGKNSITGTAFSDTLDGGNGVDKLSGGAGNDTYIVDLLNSGGIQDSVIESNRSTNEIDTIQLRGGFNLANSTDVAIAITLAANVENLSAEYVGRTTGCLNIVGNDLINNIAGSSGRDVITGAGGSDNLSGGFGDDLFIVTRASDHTSAELINGGSGIDEIRFSSTVAGTLNLSPNLSNVEYVSMGTGMELSASANGSAALNVNASMISYGLTISGNSGNNTLTGTIFDDVLFGEGGKDVLIGGNGNDSIWGGFGNDTLTGGSGSDSFFFDSLPSTLSNKDIITDFLSGTDIIWLDHAMLTGLNTPINTESRMLSADEFWSGAGVSAAHDTTDRIIYNTSSGALYYDADGSGSVAAIQIGLLGSSIHPVLTYTDISVF